MKLDTLLLDRFFNFLNTGGHRYCVMNNYTEMPEIIPSDVDFAVEISLFNKLDSVISQFAQSNGVVITQKIWHGYNKCAYILSPRSIDKFFRLQLDFFVDFCAKGFPNLMPVEYMLKDRVAYKNFFVPCPSVEGPFVMQRRIFKGDIQERHLDILHSLYLSDQVGLELGFNRVFGTEFGSELVEIIKEKNIAKFIIDRDKYYRLLKKLSSANTNIGYRVKYASMQMVRAYYRLLQPVGMNILVDKSVSQYIDVDTFLNTLAGSFHGTSYDSYCEKGRNPFNILKFLLIKRWHKTTKRLSLISTVESTVLDRQYGKKISSIDIAFTEQHDCNGNDFNLMLNSVIDKQADKTSKQLGLLLAPTSKGYSRDK
ncbi:hypothetical protein L2750_10075 [Shewanella submarina]|uniref:Nucleotidyltransferase n=1 Tax=Shewanella submarina TaxID=2016376 RepID=A0ABV7GCG6_9GAMM|nr:hypothetical protein [Shewanella submarina]MCL1037494.1 hypothetical protein [Shewanella submarina]